MRLGMGAPKDNERLKACLAPVLANIPHAYQEEMTGKVAGYNQWLQEHFPKEKPLTFERYLLFQLMPDLHNYNPFRQDNGFLQSIKDKLIGSMAKELGCTTIALRVGDYTVFTRVLDWPGNGVAGKVFLQMDRQIGGAKRTIDIGLPILSGAATVLNQDGVLIEINISEGNQVKQLQGMPAVMFNRYMAENVNSVQGIKEILADHPDQKPLGAYHLTATDGTETASFQFYQNKANPNQYHPEHLDSDTQAPHILVVANNGVQFKNGVSEDKNHRDSNERRKNIDTLFKSNYMQAKLSSYLEKQAQGKPLNQDDVNGLKEIGLEFARLPLVKNCESALVLILVHKFKEMLDARVATNNMYAQDEKLENFQRVYKP